MSTQSNSFAELLNYARQMAAGLKSHAEEVAKRGVSADVATKIETMATEAIETNKRQNAAQAKAKYETGLLSSQKKALKAELAQLRKIVKITLPQPLWSQFGIDDKQ